MYENVGLEQKKGNFLRNFLLKLPLTSLCPELSIGHTYLITEKNPNQKYFFIMEKNDFQKMKISKKIENIENIDF